MYQTDILCPRFWIGPALQRKLTSGTNIKLNKRNLVCSENRKSRIKPLKGFQLVTWQIGFYFEAIQKAIKQWEKLEFFLQCWSYQHHPGSLPAFEAQHSLPFYIPTYFPDILLTSSAYWARKIYPSHWLVSGFRRKIEVWDRLLREGIEEKKQPWNNYRVFWPGSTTLTDKSLFNHLFSHTLGKQNSLINMPPTKNVTKSTFDCKHTVQIEVQRITIIIHYCGQQWYTHVDNITLNTQNRNSSS